MRFYNQLQQFAHLFHPTTYFLSRDALAVCMAKVAYMAPELIEREGDVSLSSDVRQLDGMKCDVYSAGIMFSEISKPRDKLYEVRTKVKSFRHASHDATFPTGHDDSENPYWRNS